MSLFAYSASLLIGLVMAPATGALWLAAGLDRERGFYPAVVMAIASYYVLFAVVGGSAGAVLGELAILAVFVLLAIAGFRYGRWLLVFALALHGVLDAVHPWLVHNAGAPPWWPAFCGAYDVALACWLIMRWSAGEWRRQPCQ